LSWLRANKNAKPDYTGLQLQTSVSTLPIPIVWGQTKIAANVIWYENFRAQAEGGGGKGGGGKGGMFGGAVAGNSYTYSADLILALCEGPINGIGVIWKDQSITTLSLLGLTFYNGTTPQTPWPYLSAAYAGQALAYQGTAYVCAASYNLGDAAAISNHNFEVIGIFAGTGVNGVDADPALVINDFLTNPQYGAGFNPASINATTLFGSGGDASLQTYCKAMGVAFSPALTSQEQGSSILSRWLQLLSCAAVWSGGELKFIPYGDTSVSAGAQTTYQNQFSIPTPIPVSSGGSLPAYVEVCSASQFVSDDGVVYAFSNIPFAFIGAVAPTIAGTYGMSPNGTYVFAPPDEGKAIVVTYTAEAVSSYAPNLTPDYALTDFDFVNEKGNKDPVEVERADIFSLPTIQRVECLSRANQYTSTPVEARDQGQIEIFGPRVGPVIQAHEICDELRIGPLVAQTILQRELYIRAKFTFKLSWEYCLLDPMDVVTLTDANLGLSNCPVRIITIEEDDKGLLSVVAEELVTGVSTPTFYPNASAGGFAPNWAVPAVSVGTPLIFEPPPAASGGVAQVWVGASGVNGGPTNPRWGGANVFVSVDNTTFSRIAVLTSPLRQGLLTAAFPNASGWDAANLLDVNLTESGATLDGTSQAAAEQGATLSLVDRELLSYETATLTGANAYSLAGLARGLGGSASTSHPSGAAFARIDGAVIKYNLPANLIGCTLYFKFQSFNVFGGGLQDLSTCVVYTCTPTGAGVVDPIAAQLASGIGLDLGQISTTAAVLDDFGSVAGATLGSLNLGAAP
jgi:hypothetical protein